VTAASLRWRSLRFRGTQALAALWVAAVQQPRANPDDVLYLRQQTGNKKFCRNFEIASDRACDYRPAETSLAPAASRWGPPKSAEGSRPRAAQSGSCVSRRRIARL
jgi:hypothetical protein